MTTTLQLLAIVRRLYFPTRFTYKKYIQLLGLCLVSLTSIQGQRVPVLSQIQLPHSYYFRELYVPQLTSGPSAVAWTRDGRSLVFSMARSLWKQDITSETAIQLTDGEGYDYQPDCAPDGKSVVFVRYNGRSIELMLYDLESGETRPLTQNKGVNLEPRWSPDGKKIAFVSTMNTGHFLLYTAEVVNGALTNLLCITPDRESTVSRYYYSSFDHGINPSWSADGSKLIFVSNREIAHGSGDIVSIRPGEVMVPNVIHSEETSWKTKPDISPDGTRMVYASYAGRNWHQLWLLPTGGGYAVPLTYGEYDNTHPRWSPDGKKIAFISNRGGNTSLWLIDPFNGKQEEVVHKHRIYKQSTASLTVITRDEKGKQVPARLSICDSKGKFFAPRQAWIHADDSVYPDHQQFESHYFHAQGLSNLETPADSLYITASYGPEYEISKLSVDLSMKKLDTLVITLQPLPLPANFGNWWSGDLHIHMNYTGHYRNNPDILVRQAQAENLDFMYNLIVNKEQRIPDLPYFSTLADAASTDEVLLFHSQEFHTSFWGHLGLLNLDEHFLIPDYVGYPGTAFESLFPHNVYVADQARSQHALVGYVHPFLASQLYPEQSESLTNDLPLNAALGNVDYYELIGFADHIPSADVWYKLLNCGIRIPAGAGTDAMANYASLRGPVGLNRVYIRGQGAPQKEDIMRQLASGHSFVTNGPIIGLEAGSRVPGDVVEWKDKSAPIHYKAFIRSAVPVDYIDIIWNGKVVRTHTMDSTKKEADIEGTFEPDGPGWLLARAWSEEAHPDVFDIYPYASTNPIYFEHEGKMPISKEAASFFLIWMERLQKAADRNTNYRDKSEKKVVLDDIEKAINFYRKCILNATIP